MNPRAVFTQATSSHRRRDRLDLCGSLRPASPRSACGNATCGTFQHFRIAPVLKQYSLYLSWRRGFQPRCPLNVLAYNLTIIPSNCFRYLEFWSIGGLEIQTRSPKLRNSPQRKQYRKPIPPASPLPITYPTSLRKPHSSAEIPSF